MPETQYTIRELSQRYNLPASTLRYYEEIGLLTDVTHTPRGVRLYGPEHLTRLDGILCFKRAGLPIAKIQKCYAYEANLSAHADDILSMMQEQEASILKQQAELEAGLLHIREKILYYSEVKKAIQRGEPRPLWEEIIHEH